MRLQPAPAAHDTRVVASLPFVESLARRLAATMPHSVEVKDLVQDGVLGLIDAAHRFDGERGIKFETFAERRVRGAMIDALRKDAWPRGVRRQRRELEAAREALRTELGHEPSVSDLAARVGTDEKTLNRAIVRIATIEATSPLATAEQVDEGQLPTGLIPSGPDGPDRAYEKTELRERISAALAALPERERTVIARYYYADATMKEIGRELHVNESRVSQLHSRAIGRLRESLGSLDPAGVRVMRAALGAFASTDTTSPRTRATQAMEPQRRAVVLPYRTPVRRAQALPSRATVTARASLRHTTPIAAAR